MKSSKMLTKNKPNIINPITLDNKKKPAMVPGADKKMTKILVIPFIYPLNFSSFF